MISAFDVDHGISKSFVPGKGYVSAAKLTPGQRRDVGFNLHLKNKNRKAGVTQPVKSAAGRRIWGQGRAPTPQGKTPRVINVKNKSIKLDSAGVPREQGGYAQPNGRGGGRLVLYNSSANKEFGAGAVQRHEMAHITPRRNPHRFGQRIKEPFRAGREEARADFTALGRGRDYPGNDEFKRGYDDVIGRMSAAKKRRQ